MLDIWESALTLHPSLEKSGLILMSSIYHSVSTPDPLFGNLKDSQLTQTIQFYIYDMTNRLPQGNRKTWFLLLPDNAILEGEDLGFIFHI